MTIDSTAPIPMWIIRESADFAKSHRPDLASRVERAAFIILMRRIERNGEVWLVESECEPGKSYHVVGATCECPDFFHRAPDGQCKHRIAVSLLIHCGNRYEALMAEALASARRAHRSDERVAVAHGLAYAGARS